MKTTNQKGMSLVELMVTISVAGILVGALSFSYQHWLSGYKSEGSIKQLYGDMVNLRARAIQKQMAHYLWLNPTDKSYQLWEDTDRSGGWIPYTPKDTKIGNPKYLGQHYKGRGTGGWSVTSVGGGGAIIIVFAPRGETSWIPNSSTDEYLDISLVLESSSTVSADLNCVHVSRLRVSPGKIDSGGKCVQTS